VVVDGDRAAVVGDLSLGGQVHPLQLEVRQAADGTVTGTAEVHQTAWGIKPYTGFFGALKLRDAVEIEVSVPLGAS
jgi:polyisoprenoid-binding protein YceI